MKPLPPLLALSALSLITGCRTLGPEHQAPAPALPGSYAGTAAANAAQQLGPEGRWWELYQDAELSRLMTQALDRNANLGASLARVEEARARLAAAGADDAVKLSTDPSASYSQTALRKQGAGTFRQRQQDWKVPFTLSYELDLWGRVRRSVESARASYEATEFDGDALRLVVAGQVAETYFRWKGLLAEADVLARSRGNRGESLKLNQARLDAGLVGELDVARARQELASVEVDQADLQRRAALARNALALLCGDHVSGLDPAGAPLAGEPPVVPAGLPSEILKRRPDIAAAERRVHAANANIGVAQTASYPSIDLTANAGLESFKLNNLLKEPSQFWNFGPSVHLPIFDGGRNKAGREAAEAAHRATLENHRQTVLTALKEVEDSLVELRSRAEQSAAQERALQATTRVAELSRQRYEKGLINYFEVNDSERDLLQAERARSQLRAARFTASIQLIQALGGGWNEPLPEAKPEPAPEKKSEPAQENNPTRRTDLIGW